MIMPVAVRKPMLAVHVLSSVGWAGAVGAFLALALVGLTSPDIDTVRAVDVAAEAITRLAIIPLALASLVTGLIQSLGSRWGLLRHYWVVFKLALNVIAVVIVLLYSQTLNAFRALAAQPGADLDALRAPTFVVHSTLALLVLLAATVLAVYKPRGMTGYGRRKQGGQLEQPGHRPPRIHGRTRRRTPQGKDTPMLTSDGFVDTDRAGRYIGQLRQHFARGPGGMRADSEGEDHIRLDLGRATVSLRARPDGVLLHAEATDADDLARARRGVTERLQQIGRREGLTVRWDPAVPGA